MKYEPTTIMYEVGEHEDRAVFPVVKRMGTTMIIIPKKLFNYTETDTTHVLEQYDMPEEDEMKF